MIKLKWIVLLPNQTYNITTYNIFNNLSFICGLMDLKARFKKDNSIVLKEQVKRLLMYSFWSKAEYEIMVKLLCGKEEHKIDVYEQVMLNYDVFYDYLMDNWKQIPAKTYRQQNNERKKRGLI